VEISHYNISKIREISFFYSCFRNINNIAFDIHHHRLAGTLERSQAYGLRAGSARRWYVLQLQHIPPPCNRERAPLARGVIQREGDSDGKQILCNRVFDCHEARPLVAALRSQAYGLRAGSVRRWQHMRLAHVLPPPYNRMRASKTRALIQKEPGDTGHQTRSNNLWDEL